MAKTKTSFFERRFKPPKKGSFFLFGPRGCGKSRYLKSKYQHAKFIDLLDDKTLFQFVNSPERLEPIVKAMKDNSTLVIDEVQKAPGLLAKIHQMVEDLEFPRVRFVLTGSSSRKLKIKGADLLAGRALVKSLHPFMAAELGEDFSLDRALDLGTVPLIWSSPTPEQTLESYIAVYLKEEVKQEGLVRNLESFSRFLEAMSFSHAEILNLSNVARDCAIKRSTADGYLEILEDLLLGYRIKPFKKQNRKQTIESDKFYYFDAGVFRSLRPSGPLDPVGNLIGAAFEGFVLQNLKAWVSYREKKEEIYFWHTQAGNEVDFVIYGPKTFLAIEVKNITRVRPADLSGLKSFQADYPNAKCLLLYRGKAEQKYDSIHCLPVEKFLLSL